MRGDETLIMDNLIKTHLRRMKKENPRRCHVHVQANQPAVAVVGGQGEKRRAGAFALQTFFVRRGHRTSEVRRLSMNARERAMQHM